jgi:hypothetical protein
MREILNSDFQFEMFKPKKKEASMQPSAAELKERAQGKLDHIMNIILEGNTYLNNKEPFIVDILLHSGLIKLNEDHVHSLTSMGFKFVLLD